MISSIAEEAEELKLDNLSDSRSENSNKLRDFIRAKLHQCEKLFEELKIDDGPYDAGN